MRRGFGFLGVLLTAILLAAVGVVAYQAGWSAGAGAQLPAATAAAPYYYYGPHFWGFGLFGFLWFLFIVFVLFWLFRFAFFGRRFWGGGGGYGYRGRHGGGVPPAIDERMQDWHRRAHGEQPATGTPPAPNDKQA
jgi:hypothetical protein